jgi:hypothetical protein
MSYTTKLSPVLFGSMLLAACDASPAAPVVEPTVQYSQVAPERTGTPSDTPTRGTVRDPQRPDVTRRPDVRRHPRPTPDRLAAAAREAIANAMQLLERVSELVGRDTRPAIQEALAEARQLISQAIEAYNNHDFSRALVKAKNATDILEMIVRVLSA